jgi:hypothetical protein
MYTDSRKHKKISLIRRGENSTGVVSSIWLMNTDPLNTENERDK